MTARRQEKPMNPVLRTTLALAVLVAAAPLYAQATGTVDGLEVRELDDATEIRIRAFDHASYSVYRLRNPLRLFIDVSGADLDGEAMTVDVDNGVVTQVAATEYQDELATVSRVVIGFEQDALYDVVADGEDLVVTIDAAGRNLFLAEDPRSEQDMALLAAELERTMERVRALDEAVAVAESEQQEAETALLREHLAREIAERDRLAALAARESTAQENEALRSALAQSDAQRASAEASLEAQREQLATVARDRETALADVERLRTIAEEREAALDARDAELARLQQRLEATSAAIDRADSAPELERLQGERAAQQQEAQALRAELERLEREADESRRELQQSLDLARASQAEQQALIDEQAATIARLQNPATSAAEITDIRFEHVDGVDRVVIETGANADYRALPAEAGRSGVVLPAASLPDRLRRTLDTQAFGGPVSYVSSYTDTEGNVRVVAELGGEASEILREEDNRLVWEFAPMAATAATSAAPGTSIAATSYDSPYAVATGQSGSGSPFLQRPQMTRKRITIDLRAADIQNILRLIADEGNINIVAGAGVRGQITLRLRSVPLDDALMVILRSQNLGWEQQGNIIRVAPMAEFEERYDREMAMLENAWRLEPLRVRLIPVNYATARDLLPLVRNVLSSRGRVEIDARNNALVVTDIADHLDTAEQLVQRVDTQTPQILIEARIVETNDNFRRQLGIQWGGDFIADQSLGNATGLLFPSTIGIAGGASDGQEPTAGTSSQPNFAVNLPAPAGTGSGGALGFTFGSLSGAFNLNIRLSAAENSGTAKVVSAPRIMTLDNEAASISSGVSIPVSVVSAAGAQTVFFDAALNLDVTPRVTPDGNIFLEVDISKNEPDFENTGARGDPSIIRREASTQLLVADGDTTVIGGIFQRNSGYSQERVPFFGSIPIIGALFRNSSQTDVRNELLVFITPRIVNREESIESLTSGGQIDTQRR
jgi:type IV pilus assembly protein PilQ